MVVFSVPGPLIVCAELLFLVVSALPHWRQRPSACAGRWPAAVCESRPSPGQAEPLCYPLLPCVPLGFFTLSSSSQILCRCCCFKTELQLFKSTLFWMVLPLVLIVSLLGKTKTSWKTSHHLLLSELLTMQIPSLSSSALPSLSLLSPPSLFLSFFWGRALSFSLYLLPLSCPSSFKHLLKERKTQIEWYDSVTSQCVQVDTTFAWWWGGIVI